MKVIAVILIIFGLVIGIVPQFTNCEAHGSSMDMAHGEEMASSTSMPMRCYWSAQAEMAVAGPMLVVGGFMTVSRNKESHRILTVLGIVLGVFAILIPTYLIGVCASFEMLCNSLMKPLLIFGGTVVAVASLIGLAVANRDDSLGYFDGPDAG